MPKECCRLSLSATFNIPKMAAMLSDPAKPSFHLLLTLGGHRQVGGVTECLPKWNRLENIISLLVT